MSGREGYREKPAGGPRVRADIVDVYVFRRSEGATKRRSGGGGDRVEFLQLLREHDIAVVVADTAGKWPQIEEVTAADFVYVRLHGAEELYASGYTDQALDEWAAKLLGWAGQGLDVFTYFDNDLKGYAPYDAMRMISRVSG